jgi:hypothetical protein
MRAFTKIVIGLTLLLCTLLGTLVFAPRAFYGAPAQGWLTYSLCRIPCWRNIRPGVTRLSEGQTLLRRYADVELLTQISPLIDGAQTVRFTLSIKASSAFGTLHTRTRSTSTEDGLITSITFDNLLDTRLVDVTRQIGMPSRIGAMQRTGDGVLFMIDFHDQHISVMANLSESTLQQLCILGFEQIPLDYLILHDGTPNNYPGVAWTGYDALRLELCEPGR